MADPNTRAGKRTPVTLKIKFKSETLEQFIERYAVDVSQGGIFIRTKEPLAVGTQMRFEFQLRDASPLIGGEGTVVWTRENDPSRPAIAPGMGVRFDRLAEGSQSVLERILAEKAKQAPQRTGAEPTKPPPLFTDQPTRVAPLPVQEQLLGAEKPRRRPDDSYNDQITPLPKPVPFHSDADEFPEEAFEEATKVRALEELALQTAEVGLAAPAPLAAEAPRGDDLARRLGRDAPPIAPAARAPFQDLESVPGLPSPPEAGLPAKPGRLLDASPSPRIESPLPAPPPTPTEPIGVKTKLGLGLEAPRMAAPSAIGVSSASPGAAAQAARADSPAATLPSMTPPGGSPVREADPRPAGARATAAEPKAPVRMTAPSQKRSGAAIAILILVLVAAGAAGVWFFVLRDKATEQVAKPGSGSGSDKAGSGSDKAGSGSDKIASGSGSSAEAPPAAKLADTVIEANVPGASVEIVGTDQRGAAPFTAKLEKDKPFKARVTAPGHLARELDVTGGGPNQTATLDPKPRKLSLKTDPTGALISVDNVYNGKTTPFEVELTKAQIAKKSVRIRLVKNGYKTVDKVVPLDSFTEDADQMLATVEEKLTQQAARPPGGGSGSQTGTQGSGTPDGSGGTPPPPDGSGAPPPPPPPPPEPEPDVSKP